VNRPFQAKSDVSRFYDAQYWTAQVSAEGCFAKPSPASSLLLPASYLTADAKLWTSPVELSVPLLPDPHNRKSLSLAHPRSDRNR
jgi:hypothetical protein